MKILIYGAGILGRLYAYLLQKAGIAVEILARGATLHDIRTNGITLNFVLQNEKVHFSIPTIEILHPSADYSLIIVVMQKQQVKSVLPIIAAVNSKPDVIILGNNGTALEDYRTLIDPDQILLGFPSAGGRRRNGLIDVVYSTKSAINIGEIDGKPSSRVKKWQDVFQSADIKLQVVPNIDAWLKYHIALVSPLANALYAVDCDNYALAKTSGLIDVGVDAIREGFAILKALNYPMLPPSLKFIYYPKWLIRWMVKKRMATIYAEIAMAGHAKYAHQEMQQIADEFERLIQQTQLPASAIHFLYQFLDETRPRVRTGASKDQLNIHLYK